MLGPVLTQQFANLVSIYDQPPGGQYTGWHIYMYKDLRTMLGKNDQGKYAYRYCGAGPCVTRTMSSGRIHFANAACTSLAPSST